MVKRGRLIYALRRRYLFILLHLLSDNKKHIIYTQIVPGFQFFASG